MWMILNLCVTLYKIKFSSVKVHVLFTVYDIIFVLYLQKTDNEWMDELYLIQ
jgi:hypothetical protein